MWAILLVSRSATQGTPSGVLVSLGMLYVAKLRDYYK